MIALDTHCPALDTLQAVQGAKSGEKLDRERKGKVPRLPQKTSTIVLSLVFQKPVVFCTQ